MRRAFLLIHNPLAGRRGNKITHRVIAALAAHGALVHEIKELTIDAARIQVNAELDNQTFDAAIVAGGDGTLRAMAPLLAKYNIPVGLVPAGTGNVLAHEIGQNVNVSELVHTLMTGVEIQIQSSRANGETFFLMAGVGFDGDIVARLDLASKKRFGKLAYVWPFIRALLSRPRQLSVEIDGTLHCASWVIATRARHYAGTFVLEENANLCNSHMTAFLFKSTTRHGRLWESLALATNQLDHLGGVQKIVCNVIKVSALVPVAAQADGDAIGMTPLEISTGHAPLRLIVNEDFARTANQNLYTSI